MTLTPQAATLRAALKRELVRLGLRAHEGGPHVVYREGVLLAVWPDGTKDEVTEEYVAALETIAQSAIHGAAGRYLAQAHSARSAAPPSPVAGGVLPGGSGG